MCCILTKWNSSSINRSVVSDFATPRTSSPGSSVHGILQARILEWVAIPFTRGSSWPRDQTRVFCIAGRFFTVWVTGKSQNETIKKANKIFSLWATGLQFLVKMYMGQRKDIKVGGLKIQFLILSWPLVGNFFLLSGSHFPQCQEEAGKLRVSRTQ